MGERKGWLQDCRNICPRPQHDTYTSVKLTYTYHVVAGDIFLFSCNRGRVMI